MPDPTQTTATPVVEQQPASSDSPTVPAGLDEHIEQALGVADKFIKEQEAAQAAAAPVETAKRDDKGRFAPKVEKAAKGPAEPGENPDEPVVDETEPPVDQVAPKISEMWAFAAKAAGMTPEEIATIPNDSTAQQQIQVRRQNLAMQALQASGIDLNEFQAWQASRQQGGQQPVQQQVVPFQHQTVATTIDELKLDLPDGEIAPEDAARWKAVQDHVNKLATQLAADAKVKDQLAQKVGAYEQQQQEWSKAVQERQAEDAGAAFLDDVVAKIPGFTEVLGKPSEVLDARRQNPMDPRVQQFDAFLIYGQPAVMRWIKEVGRNDAEVVVLAMKEAFNASPFSKLPKNGEAVLVNGKHGNNGYGNGSVPRGTPRRGSAEKAPPANSAEAEQNRIAELIGAEWERGGNPFASAS